MEEFLKREGGDQGQFPIPEQNRTKTMISATGCDKRKKSMSSFVVYILRLFDTQRL